MDDCETLNRSRLTSELRELGLFSDATSSAFELAQQVHLHQKRAGGGPYLEQHIYPITSNVARYLIECGWPEPQISVLVSLLHDAIEDSQEITRESIEAKFGSIVAAKVSALTKPEKRPGAEADVSEEAEERYVAGIERAEFDVRVIKVFDRLNNLAAVHLREPSRCRIYLAETRKHYIALARGVDPDLADRMLALLEQQEERFRREYGK